MATEKKTTPPADKKADATKYEIVTQNITVRSNDRSKKDVSTLQAGLIRAESVVAPSRVRLYNVYLDVMRDGHLTGIIGKRIDSVANKKLSFKKGDVPDKEINNLINSKVFRDMITMIMESKFWGLSGLEFLPGDKLSFQQIPRKHIRPGTQVITMDEGAIEGIPYANIPNIWIIGDKDDLGLLLKCGFYALLKKGAITDWAEYIEVFGSPIISMTYDAGDWQTEAKLDAVLEQIGNSTRLKIPKQAELKVQDGKASNGDGKLQDIFRRAMNEEMSIIVVGNTETTNSSKSSGFAQSKTHSDQQKEIIKADMVDVLDYLNSDKFMNILRSYGYNVDGGKFEYDREIDISYMSEKILVDKEVAALGVPIPAKYFYDTYAIDAPKEGEAIHVVKPAAAAPPEPPKGKKPIKGTPAPDMSDDSAPATIGDIKAMFTSFFGPGH